MTPSSSTETLAPVAIREALQVEGIAVATFLARPDIDASFQRPLHERSIHLAERVNRVTRAGGRWVVAVEDGGPVVGCWSWTPQQQPGLVKTSTFVIDPAWRGSGLGRALWTATLRDAIQSRRVQRIMLDSWEGNEVVAHLATQTGFAPVRRFNDPAKRGPGGVTVEYEADAAILRDRLSTGQEPS